MTSEPKKPDPIAEYLTKVFEAALNGGDVDSISDKKAMEAVMEIRRNARPYEFPKKPELQNLSDEDLEMAAMDWITSRISDWSSPAKELLSLPRPCRHIYSCLSVIHEVGNGGFNQLFYNSMLPIAEMAIEGFLALDSPKLSCLMKSAVSLYQNNKHILDSYNDGTIKGFSASYNEKIFDELDKIFIEESVNIACYIKLNAECFTDDLSDKRHL